MHVKHRMARCQESQPWWSYRAKSEENCHVPVRVTARLLHSQLAALRMSSTKSLISQTSSSSSFSEIVPYVRSTYVSLTFPEPLIKYSTHIFALVFTWSTMFQCLLACTVHRGTFSTFFVKFSDQFEDSCD